MILHIVYHYIPYNKINAKNRKQYITYYISDFKQKMIQKPPFLGILGQNGQFWTVFWPKWENGKFFQKSAWDIIIALTSHN